MDRYIKQWFCFGVFLCLFSVFQMFSASLNRLTVSMSYFTNLILYIALMYSTYINYKYRKKDTFEFIKKEHDRWQDIIKDFPHRCTWQCDICHDYRTDALIGVVKYRDDSGFTQLNIKHCKDKLECIHKANALDMLWRGEKVYRME